MGENVVRGGDKQGWVKDESGDETRDGSGDDARVRLGIISRPKKERL